MLEVEFEVDGCRFEEMAAIEEQDSESNERELSASQERECQRRCMERKGCNRRQRLEQPGRFDEVILEDPRRIQLGQEPVLQVIRQHPSLRQQALGQAEIPRRADAEEVVPKELRAETRRPR